MKVAVVRGSYFNKYEMQNYEPLAKKHRIVGFSGLKTIHKSFAFPLVKLPSPVDLPNFPCKMPILNRLFLGDAMLLFGLKKRLKGFDVVHVRETYFHFTQQAIKAKKPGLVKKVICTCSETIPFNHEGIWRRKIFKQRAYKQVDIFHCLTQKAKECLIKEGCDPKKIIVFPYGVNIQSFQPQKKSSKSKIRLLFVGRLVKEKGIYDLLKVFIELIKQKNKVSLTIIGSGSEKTNIINLINQIRLNKLIKIKQVSYNEIPKEYKKADIFILLSKPTKYWEEYFGMALVEAMASGLPIVSTDCGAIPEVVSDCGLLVKPGDWQSALKSTEELIKNKGLRDKLGSKARKRAEKYFDHRKVARNIEKLWMTNEV